MHGRLAAGALLVIVFAIATIPLAPSSVYFPLGGWLSPSAEAKPRIRNLLDRLRGKKMPEGVVKTNGRIEATQVDVATKYAGRVTDITVEEGSEVKEGDVIGRISSPETEAQLRAAQANVERAKQALAEAKSVMAERNAVLYPLKRRSKRNRPLAFLSGLSEHNCPAAQSTPAQDLRIRNAC